MFFAYLYLYVRSQWVDYAVDMRFFLSDFFSSSSVCGSVRGVETLPTLSPAANVVKRLPFPFFLFFNLSMMKHLAEKPVVGQHGKKKRRGDSSRPFLLSLLLCFGDKSKKKTNTTTDLRSDRSTHARTYRSTQRVFLYLCTYISSLVHVSRYLDVAISMGTSLGLAVEDSSSRSSSTRHPSPVVCTYRQKPHAHVPQSLSLSIGLHSFASGLLTFRTSVF